MKRTNKGRKALNVTQKEIVERYWDYVRNDSEGLYPEELTHGSGVEVNWACTKGHKYRRQIISMVKEGRCFYCNKILKVSEPQRIMYSILSTNFKKVYLEHVFEGQKFKYDIYVEDIGLVVEYDGKNWHRKEDTINHDKRKARYVKENFNVNTYRVREKGCYTYGEQYYEEVKEHNYQRDIKKQFEELKNITYDMIRMFKEPYILSENEYIPYTNSMFYDFKNNLFTNYTRLDNYFSERNNVDKLSVSRGSNKVFWWVCEECGEDYLESPYSLTRRVKLKAQCKGCRKFESKKQLKKGKERAKILDRIREDKVKENKIKATKTCHECGSKYKEFRKYKTRYCSLKCQKQEYKRCDDEKESLLEHLKGTPNFTELGLIYGVSDNAIRKKCKKYGVTTSIKYWVKRYEDKNGYTYRQYKTYKEYKDTRKEDLDYVVRNYGIETRKYFIDTTKLVTPDLYNTIGVIHNLEQCKK